MGKSPTRSRSIFCSSRSVFPATLGKTSGTLRGSFGNTFRANVRQQCPRVFSQSLTLTWRGAAHILPATRGGDRMEDPLHESGDDVPAVGAGHVAVIGMADLERASAETGVCGHDPSLKTVRVGRVSCLDAVVRAPGQVGGEDIVLVAALHEKLFRVGRVKLAVGLRGFEIGCADI